VDALARELPNADVEEDTMADEREYLGHTYEITPAESADAGAGGEVRIDGERHAYGRLPDGSYFISDYAYDWQGDVEAVVRRYIETQAGSEGPGRADEGPGE
jgi:hypothetical protein